MRWVNFFHIYQPPGWNEEIIHRVARESYEPIAAVLGRNPKAKLTLNFSGSLIEQLAALGYDALLASYRRLIERGQIELVGTAMYHPILPLIPEAEVRRQIARNYEIQQRVFGLTRVPAGFFAPEMAFDPSLIPILQDLGFTWIIVDETVVAGTIGGVAFSDRLETKSGFGIVVRNHPISNYLAFSPDVLDFQKTRQTLLQGGHGAAALVTAMDGEIIGHHRPGADALWEKLLQSSDFITQTVSEYRRELRAVKKISPAASSWSSQESELRRGIPFGLWRHPDNPIHQLQWQLTDLVIDAVHRSVTDPAFTAVRLLLDRALASDKYWWASASPWWDMPIILRETQKLADVIDPISDLPIETKNRVAQCMDQITETVRHWDQDGLAKQRQTTYLKDVDAIHYMAGRQVTGK